jgi:predicted enzyme related to lactoylglutathione lyase
MLFIDCAPDGFERGNEFWSAALGRTLMRSDDERYTSLKGRLGGEGGIVVGLQRVPEQERAYHLDIETDDIEAEVARLERLGARVKARIREHVVMLAPTGHAFCVVQVYRPDFAANAVTWKDAGDAE